MANMVNTYRHATHTIDLNVYPISKVWHNCGNCLLKGMFLEVFNLTKMWWSKYDLIYYDFSVILASFLVGYVDVGSLLTLDCCFTFCRFLQWEFRGWKNILQCFFLKNKLCNRLTEHLPLVRSMFSQKQYISTSFPYKEVVWIRDLASQDMYVY